MRGPDNAGRMRLLDRYLLRELLVPLGYCLGGFLIFWITSDLISDLDVFQRFQLLPRDVAAYYLVRMPELLVTVLPVALLLALLYTLPIMAGHQVLTAMRAAGLSLWRLCVPYLVVGSILGGVLFALNEVWVPDAYTASRLILRRRIPVAPGDLGPEWQRNLVFHNDANSRLWQIGAFNRLTGEMLSLNLEWRFPDGGHRRLAAERADYTNGHWVLQDVKELLYTPESRLPAFRGMTNRLALAELTETPELINSEIRFTELSNVKAAKGARLSLREILDYERLHPRLNPRARAKLETQFHGRLAEPWKCIVVVLIAIPFGAPSGRRNVFVGVASSIFIAFAYFFIAGFSLALGTGDYIAPWLAAWLPNALFTGAAIWLMQRIQ